MPRGLGGGVGGGQEHLYKLGEITKGQPPNAADAVAGNDDDGDGDNAHDDNDDNDGPGPVGDDASPGPEPRADSAESEEAVSLMREYLESCLQPGKYVSLPNPSMTRTIQLSSSMC